MLKNVDNIVRWILKDEVDVVVDKLVIDDKDSMELFFLRFDFEL